MPSIIWVVLIQSAEGLGRMKADLPKVGDDSAKRLPLNSNYNSYLCPACGPTPSDFRLNNYMKSLYLSLSLFLSVHFSVSLYTYINLVSSVFLENTYIGSFT